jgi:hypothetical protein
MHGGEQRSRRGGAREAGKREKNWGHVDLLGSGNMSPMKSIIRPDGTSKIGN